ncbi:SWIB/MDM2 domain-containing protein [Sphingomonas sp. BIUV-7]|uniref:SWIB/MDM2 domain-containing protein n=1 Tax=Sphingomonas natans TaxID=3063330 RepID=A0ABT8YEJ4_9SPHN|nr:SWIB/MDM2 domain-containing protein [Sphingomonas sp. BIUV-7]MDO6416367.1 SWIB/MDM2 domain-containing protein [Sphingomonas sp. BIUV-7]
MAKATTAKATTAKAPTGGIHKPVTPSAELGAIVGTSPLPRSEIVSKMWEYIKKNNLQDAKDKRQINADDKLEKVFGKKSVSMFEMNKHISTHVK